MLEVGEKASINRSSSIRLAEIHARLEERDQAFEQLEKAFQDRDLRLIELNVRQELASLRADARFKSLQRRMGLLK